MTALLHSPTSVYSRRHVPSWLLLAFGAGAVNAGALLGCQRFVSHVTGTATRLGVDAGQWWLVAEYGIVLVCFIAGAATSVLLLQRRLAQQKRPLFALPLVLVASILVVVAVAGSAGGFGPFGSTVESPSDFLLLSILSFAMGLQNATVGSATGLAVRTTHLTGPASDLGVHLGMALISDGEARRSALENAALRAGKIVSFIFGGAAMAMLVPGLGYLAFAVPAATILMAAALSFRSPAEPDTDRRDAFRRRFASVPAAEAVVAPVVEAER